MTTIEEQREVLRDEIARQVLTAEMGSLLIAADFRRAANSIATRAYIVADAMLTARAKDHTDG
jgi:hypothetical protein